jgi:hypothetical protein
VPEKPQLLPIFKVELSLTRMLHLLLIPAKLCFVKFENVQLFPISTNDELLILHKTLELKEIFLPTFIFGYWILNNNSRNRSFSLNITLQ